jgi:hypothetical protein
MEPHFVGGDAWVTWSIFTTKRPAGGSAFKGGLSTWPKLERELQRLLRDSSTTVLTTMFDYYAFPSGAPGMADRPHGSPHESVRHVESALARAIGDERFLPNLDAACMKWSSRSPKVARCRYTRYTRYTQYTRSASPDDQDSGGWTDSLSEQPSRPGCD